MTVTLAMLDDRVFLGLQPLGEYLTLPEIHSAVVARLNVRTMQSRSSDINVLLAVTDPFTVDTIPYDVTNLIGKARPAWVETLSDPIDNFDRWFPVRVVPLAQIGDYIATGMFACAFHGEEPDNELDQPTQYLTFTYIPGNSVRIRYDRDSQRTELASDILLPDNLAELVVLEAQNSLIPRLANRIAMGLRRDADGRKDAGLIIGTLNAIRDQNLIDIVPLKKQWEIYVYRDRATETSFDKLTPSGSNLYPVSGTWGGYFGSGAGW